MKSLKRSKSITLNRFRKSVDLRPVGIGLASIFLSACADDRELANLYLNPEECASKQSGYADLCQATYRQALEEAQDTAPRYNSLADCEYDFGRNQCIEEDGMIGNYFMPVMAGYLVGNMVSRSPYVTPMFTSYSPYSPLRYRWFSADGMDIGDIDDRDFKLKRKYFNKRPTRTSTLKRGGFGQTVKRMQTRSSSRSWGG